jgi:hypothetical protein
MPTITSTYYNTKEYQIQGKNQFDVQFDESNGLWNDSLTLLVKSFPLPKETTDVNTIDHFNQQIKLAGKTTFDGGELVIHDALSKDVELMFRKWRKLVFDAKQGKVGYAADYKIDGTVNEYSPNGETVRSWKLIGCWPKDVNYGELDYESGSYKDVTATIVYDWAYRKEED